MSRRLLPWLLAAPVLATQPAAAQTTVTAPAEVIVVRPLSLVKVEDMDFGTVVSGATAGTVVIDPGGDQPAAVVRTVTGGVTEAGGRPRPATFYTFGGPRQNFRARRREAQILLRRVGGTETMRLEPLVLNGPIDRFLSEAGFLELRVGGTLAVGANQPTGTYRGTFTLVVTYN